MGKDFCFFFFIDISASNGFQFLMIISCFEAAVDDSPQKVRVFVRKKRAKKSVEAMVEAAKPQNLDQKVK